MYCGISTTVFTPTSFPSHMSHNFQKCPLFYHGFNEEAFSSATDLCTVTVEMVSSLSSELLNFIFSPYTVFTHLISLFSPYTVFTHVISCTFSTRNLCMKVVLNKICKYSFLEYGFHKLDWGQENYTNMILKTRLTIWGKTHYIIFSLTCYCRFQPHCITCLTLRNPYHIWWREPHWFFPRLFLIAVTQ